jgi:hypothetical protein
VNNNKNNNNKKKKGSKAKAGLCSLSSFMFAVAVTVQHPNIVRIHRQSLAQFITDYHHHHHQERKLYGEYALRTASYATARRARTIIAETTVIYCSAGAWRF